MKKIKYISISLLFIISLVIFINISCENNDDFEKSTKVENDKSKSLDFKISDNNIVVIYKSSKNHNEINSELIILENNIIILKQEYKFDTSIKYWKLNQANNVIKSANDLKLTNISVLKTKEIIKILDENISHIFYDTYKNKDKYVVSSFNYHKSILNTFIRSEDNIKNNKTVNTNNNCNCTVHPFYLTDKMFFNCQEDHNYDKEYLLNTISEFNVLNNIQNIDNQTSNLINYLNNNSNNTINFKDYYDFYISNEDFENFIETVQYQTSGDCSDSCLLGCGSDHGCCGNYEGCCLFWSLACYIHDRTCSDCTPAWYCLPGCKPDKPATAVISIN
jgi:hypothetical protein